MTAIEVRDLVLQRKAGFRLGPLSFRVATGARMALIGPSGSGKTTLLRCLAGLETPDRGTVSFDGAVVHGSSVSPVPPEQRQIGFVFQDGALWPHLTAVQHLRFVDPRLTPQAASALLAQVGLQGAADRRPGALSGGEAQRLALARALVGRPRVLMLDEPLRSIDVHLRDALALLIRRIAEERGLTLIVVTHDRDEALAIADELVILRDGELVESGPTAEIVRAPKTAYGAAFLCRAACLPAEPRGGGDFATAFGVLAGPRERNGALALVVLPGDAVLDAAGTPGKVVRVVPLRDAAIATVELGGHTLEVACDPDIQPGAAVRLALRGTPRFLPAERKAGEERG